MHDAAAPIFSFDNLYARLPERFFTAIAPTPVRAPRLIKVNDGLARELGLDPEALASPRGVAILAGNHVPEGADPLAQAYAGHQFGGFSPRLGDGRAILLGEVIDRAGRRRDIQLKGSGPTPYSRGGDGRAGLGPVLREYLVAEGMHALGVQTTRALAAVTTGEPIFRESPEPGAILTRVAASHLRVGTLEYFAARSDHEALTVLVDHALARHYPAASGPLGLLEGVRDAQAALVAAWMALGFIHGVMNTDNTTLSGETIDYGPCAFLDTYDPRKVFSSIDHRGRYAYSNQPGIMLWNLSRLADALLPVIDPDEDKAIAAATAILEGFAPRFEAAWLAAFRRKLGLLSERDGDPSLAADLLELMAQGRADFTRTFRGLADGRAREEFENPAAFDAWVARWRRRLADEGSDPEARAPALRQANPALIPRNHRIEAAIVAAKAGDHGPFEALLAALSQPYDDPEDRTLMTAPRPEEEVKATFCGT